MADEKVAQADVPVAPEQAEYDAAPGEHVRPAGWKYREIKLGPWGMWYASPKVQLGMVSFVCFMCPGMFNALGGMGGGGRATPQLGDKMNIALYTLFAVFGFFGGTIINRLGVKWTLSFGGIGYGIYAIALLVSTTKDVSGFSIFAGALLGLCAALLWTAQGTIMISYPTEGQKGRYFAWFWGIFNMGAVIGSLIPLGQNIHVTADVTVGAGTYIGFICLMFFGAVLALLLCNASDVIREDGSHVILMKNPTWQSEFAGLWETIKFEPFIFLLFPMFLSSNWFYVYQQNSVNAAHFSTRARALNGLLYYLAQIIAAVILGYALDTERIGRRMRARLAWIMLMIVTLGIWGGGYAYEKGFTRAEFTDHEIVPTDWDTPGYVGPMFLYFFYGFFDALWQASVYWYMGALSNSGRRSANYVGFYKGIQSAGSVAAYTIDLNGATYLAEFASNWGLLLFSLVCAAPIIFFKIKDHVSIEEDLAGTDETLADVLPSDHPEKQISTA